MHREDLLAMLFPRGVPPISNQRQQRPNNFKQENRSKKYKEINTSDIVRLLLCVVIAVIVIVLQVTLL